MYRRRRRRLIIAAVIVGGIGAWLISRVPAAGGAPHPRPLSLAPNGGAWERGEDASRRLGFQPDNAREVAPALPSEPFQRCATKALRGDYGALEHWQRCAYIWGIAKGIRCCGLAKVTSYGPWESPCMSGGDETASGLSVSTKFCAANPELAFGTIIWTEYGLRYVQDRGGWVKLGWVENVGRVTRWTENANLDYYSERELATLREVPWAVVKWGETATAERGER